MKLLHLLSFFVALLACTVVYGQTNTSESNVSSRHPAVADGTGLSPNTYDNAKEMIHLRTQKSKTYINSNKTKTVVQSSIPVHYQSEDGNWVDLDYSLERKGNTYAYPAQSPIATYDLTDESLHILSYDALMRWDKRATIEFITSDEAWNRSIESGSPLPALIAENKLNFRDFFPGFDKQYTFYAGAVKKDFIIRERSALPTSMEQVIIKEIVTLPPGHTIDVSNNNQDVFKKLNVKNASNDIVWTYHQTVLTDKGSKGKRNERIRNPHEADYIVVKLDDTRYEIQTIIDAAWLLDRERVFPIVIDPVLTIENTDVVGTCYFPEFETDTIRTEIPEGDEILYTDISYDFIATEGTDAWMSDQRSFVSSMNGSTTIQVGQGDQAGTITYDLNFSPIANGVSPGIVDFVFHFSRVWGDEDECNTVFNFVNRRTVAITYGTIEYGDGPVYINEYSASNRQYQDGFGRTEDWIEIYNADPDFFFDLSGYHLSNDANNPMMWRIEDGLIPPASSVVVFCSRRDISFGVVLHSNFNLTQLRPDQIVFADRDGNIIETHEMFVTQTNHSYGRITDGGDEWGVFQEATPGRPNQALSPGYTSKPTFNIEPGRYEDAVAIVLSSEHEEEEIRYTLDGSTPGVDSELYTGPFLITETTVIRARAYDPEGVLLPGFIETNTYFINEHSTLPVFSFAGDADMLELFGGNIALRPIGHFEYFESDGSFIDENLGDFDKHGNDSWEYDQRGVDFVSRDDHGYKRRLEHKFFQTSDRTRFRRLMVKAAANDNYPFEEGGAYVRDAYIQHLSQLSGFEMDERSTTFVSVFVNGTYWGVYDLRERVDDNNFTDFYYDQNYTFRESDIYLQYIKSWGLSEAHFGNEGAIQDWQSLVNFIENNDMSSESNLETVESLLNIESLIDYFVYNSYIVSRDWLNYNTGWWRGLDPAGQAQQWRYTLWDMDAALGHFENYTGMPDVTATAPPCQVEDLDVGFGHERILRKLINENPEMRRRYITRYVDLLNTHLSCERVIEVLDSMVMVITPEMPRQIERWGGTIEEWLENVEAVRNFLLTRCDHLMETGIGSCYDLTGPFETVLDIRPAAAGSIRMNSEWLPHYPFQANNFGNIETILTAEDGPGFVFSHWEVEGVDDIGDLSLTDLVMNLTGPANITAVFMDPTVTDDDLIYYWHFNSLNTPQDVISIPADYSAIDTSSPTMTYTGEGPRDIDANNNGSTLNAHQDQGPGRCARVRNPSEDRTLVFDLPTGGYKDIKFTYAVMRTNNGQLRNLLSYSIDGETFTQEGLDQEVFEMNTDFDIVHLDFTDIPEVNNNPNFKVQIAFDGNTTNLNGNNRYDNITLKGILDSTTSIQRQKEASNIFIYPNPFSERFFVESDGLIEKVEIYSPLGQKLHSHVDFGSHLTMIDLGGFTSGVYIISVHTNGTESRYKLVKE